MKLNSSYYLSTDVVGLSRDLIGKYLFTHQNGALTGGKIVETEAYAGVYDKACHARGGLRTRRTEIMYQHGGVGYVYLCYGIHNLFNVITGPVDVPHAILIRAVEPVVGVEHIMARRGHEKLKRNTAGGPGLVCQALGIEKDHNGVDLTEETIWIEDRGEKYSSSTIISGKRVGIGYAGEDADKPYRFRLSNSGYTSPAK
ncbi:MAG: DNA-3-methyladenine glycosylase [Balneolales bacterium]